MAIASLKELERFDGSITDSLRGLLVEMATCGVVRYEWKLMLPLIEAQMQAILDEYGASAAGVKYLTVCVEELTGPPFTLQRLAELLLEPKKQYSNSSKLIFALEKLLSVSTTIPKSEPLPEPPKLSDLRSINETPPSVTSRLIDSSDIFKGFLVERTVTNTGPSPDLTSHLFTTVDSE